MRCLRELLACTLILQCASAIAAPAKPSVRPNVIVITLDTTRADRMGFLGSRRGLTPNLDRLAQQSVVFQRAYSHVPLTTPSHATIFTGTYPQFNQVVFMGQPLASELPYLPDLLRRRGYQTAAFVGSFILDNKNPIAAGFDRGFTTYDAGYHPKKKGEDRYKSVERRAGEVVDHAVAWLSKHPQRPFFLWIHCYDPHGPYDPPEPYKSRFAEEPYDGEIAYTDAAMGKLLDSLRTRSLYDNTVIALMADHGEAFGEHGEREHGVFLYDATIHVPLLMKLPRNQFSGERVKSRVRLVDVAPTILQIAGVTIPASMQGQSMLALIHADVGAKVADRPAFSETDYAHRAFGWSALQAWRSDKYLYVKAPERELYDQSSDPSAVRNIADGSKAVADTLASQMEEFRKQTSSGVAGKTTLDPEAAENLRALGYLPSSSRSGDELENENGPDPKGRVETANLMHEAIQEMQDDRFDEAIPKLEQVLQAEPNTSLAYRELGRAYLRQKAPQKAVPVLKKAVEKLPEDGLARYELGRALVETNNWVDAVPQFEAAVARSQKSPELRFYLAVVYERTGRTQEAMQAFRRTVELDPKHFKANLLLGRLLGMEGKPSEALFYLKTAAKLDPTSVEAHMFLANVYGTLGQMENAAREQAAVDRLKAGSAPPSLP